MKTICKGIIDFLGLKFRVTQCQCGRKLYGGTWYFCHPNIMMCPFWSDTIITSCQAKLLKTEHYELRN